ncbi:SIP domain-containing protein [Stenotrophomonas indicatrix]|uniref:SIP domain-containing protein n=1 Tax=Stenotrophomonas indicatrix TaxID=2045451 RepID=UPI003D0EF994
MGQPGQFLEDAGHRRQCGLIDVDAQILWEQADASADGALYAWVAGEAGAVMAIRRHLLKGCGLDRRAITFMGYWRQGRVLD